MATIPFHQSNYSYGISDAPMANYEADTTAPVNLVKFVTSDQQTAEIGVNVSNNENYSTGNDWATEQWQDTHEANFPFTIDPTIMMLRRLLNAALGAVATTSPVAGATQDIYTPQNANVSRQLPAYWMSEKIGAAHNGLYPSCVMEKLTLKGEELGRLNASGNLRGSGRQIIGDDYIIVAETNKYYLKNTMSKVVRAAAAVPGTPVQTYQCGLQSFMLDIDNAMDANVGYDPGCQRFYLTNDPDSGIIRSYHPFGRRKYSGQFVIWLADSSPELAIIRAQTPVNLRMGMYGSQIVVGAVNTMEIEMHLAYYQAVEIGNKNGFVTLVITPNVFYNELTSQILSVKVIYPTPA